MQKTVWVERFLQLCNEKEILTGEHPVGIFVDDGIDKWIVEIITTTKERNTKVTLYHSNLLDFGLRKQRKRGYRGCTIPDYHIQKIGSYTPEQLINIIIEHRRKWNGGANNGHKSTRKGSINKFT